MQHHNHPDQDKAREIFLERLQKASTGRHVPHKERPAGLFVKVTEKLPSFLSIITGQSRTADIEKTLILGAHGPKVLHVLITRQDF